MTTEGFQGATAQLEITNNEFQLFHSVDRRLYTILCIELLRNPFKAMLVMAFWLWLEKEGLQSIILKILTLPPTLISELADEALKCLDLINYPLPLLPNEGFNIPLTQSLLKPELSLQYLKDNQNIARCGVAEVHNDICVKAFYDIKKDAVSRYEDATRLATENQQMALQPHLHPNGFSTGQLNNNSVLPAEERTMFITFSRGYPVTEWEVRVFFTNMFGNCIESFYMQDVSAQDEQALFAKIVFFRHDTIETILSGMPKAKFIINGKHVWMRKFVPKQQRTVPMQRPHPNHSGVVKLPVTI